MASDRPQLEVDEREERGSRATRRLRRQGLVPGIVYGIGDCESFKVDARVLRQALHAGSAVLDLKIAGGKARPVIIKDQHHHAIRDEVLHIDLLEVNLKEKIQSTITVELTGAEDAPGVKEGGVIEHVTRELNIEALPTDLPESITIDISHLEPAGTMSLSEVTAPQGVEFLDDLEETVIATVTIPTEVVEPEIEEETELVGEEAAEVVGEEAEGAESAGEGGEDTPETEQGS